MSNDILEETEHVGSTFTDERNEYHDNKISLEDLPFIPKLNGESSIKEALIVVFSMFRY